MESMENIGGRRRGEIRSDISAVGPLEQTEEQQVACKQVNGVAGNTGGEGQHQVLYQVL